MSESRIHSALVSAFIASGVMPAERTAFEGREFTPTQGQSWARLNALPSGSAPAAMGGSAPQEWTGILQISLFHPKGTGHADILDDADAVLSVFVPGRRLTYQSQSVLIRSAERSPIRTEDVWQSVVISIYCMAWVFRPPLAWVKAAPGFIINAGRVDVALNDTWPDQ